MNITVMPLSLNAKLVICDNMWQYDDVILCDYPKIYHFRELKSTKVDYKNAEIHCRDILFLLNLIITTVVSEPCPANNVQLGIIFFSWDSPREITIKGGRAIMGSAPDLSRDECTTKVTKPRHSCQRCWFAYQIRLWTYHTHGCIM